MKKSWSGSFGPGHSHRSSQHGGFEPTVMSGGFVPTAAALSRLERKISENINNASVKSYQLIKVVSGGRVPGKSSILVISWLWGPPGWKSSIFVLNYVDL